MHVTFEQAEKAMEAAIRESKIGTQMCIAVVDSGADLKAFVRMDDAWVGSVDIAIKKAKTACFFGMNTGQIGELSQPGGPLYGIEHSNDGLITFPGGVPIVDENGVLIGAIGVSGSSVENDHQVAKAGVVVIGMTDLPAASMANLNSVSSLPKSVISAASKRTLVHLVLPQKHQLKETTKPVPSAVEGTPTFTKKSQCKNFVLLAWLINQSCLNSS